MSGRGPPPHLAGPGSPRRDRDRRYERYEDSPRNSDGASPRRDRVRDRSRSPRRDRYDDRERSRTDRDRYDRYDGDRRKDRRDRDDDRDYKPRDRDRRDRDYEDDGRDRRERSDRRPGEGDRDRDARAAPRSRHDTAEAEDVKPVIKTEPVDRESSRGPPPSDAGGYANGARGGYAARGVPFGRGRGGYGGYQNGSGRGEEYDRPLDRRAIEEGRRRREEERARGVVYTEEGKFDPTAEQEPPQDSGSARQRDGDEEMDEEDEEASMAAMMGFGGFGTTKGKGVDDNVDGAAKVHKQRTWRQYMNRRGGFNRPLDKIV